ncbi:hypothetical protein [Butyrivibrio sp. NC2002]|uniref:hypothetical protein n=1 Tax=Butyrivibrio sp. NC2002 TaxID=1410610 RepID=UPI00055AC624|nr:hypothetical protein [Butyrivibrio sp. NC2002]
MKHFSRIGAAALALALSVTFVTPTTVLAATETKRELNYNYEYEDDSDLIESSRTVVGTYSDDEEGYDAMRAAAKANGWVTSTYSNGLIRAFYDDDEDKAYYWNKGYYGDDDDDYHFIVTYTTYTNIATGVTSTSEGDVNKRYSSDSADYHKIQSSIKIKKGETTYLCVPLKNGDTEIKNVKSKKKSVFTAKSYSKMGSVYSTANIANIEEEKNADGTYTIFYYNSLGEKIVVGNSKDSDIESKIKNTNGSSAYKYIKLVAKKAGKGKLTYNIFNKNGVKTGTASITVYVQDDTSVLKTFTFAGKSLLSDYSANNNLNFGKKETDTLWNVSTKGKGKLVVKANKNYKITKIEVGKLYTETKAYADGKGTYTTTSHTVDGKDVTYNYTPVKSGKKIKLSKVCYYDTDLNYANDEYGNKSSYTDGTNSRTTNISGLYAPTYIRVTYYDKITKTYGVTGATIYYKAKK